MAHCSKPPEAAKAEFTVYTLRRGHDAIGWLKLGSAQLRLGEVVAAERSYSSVLSLKTDDAAAYNGLGLARAQRNRPRDAQQFFSAAVPPRHGRSVCIAVPPGFEAAARPPKEFPPLAVFR